MGGGKGTPRDRGDQRRGCHVQVMSLSNAVGVSESEGSGSGDYNYIALLSSGNSCQRESAGMQSRQAVSGYNLMLWANLKITGYVKICTSGLSS